MSVDLLEQRLQSLSIETPSADRISRLVLTRAATPKLRRSPRIAGLGIAIVALVILVAYFVPAVDLALAGVPVAGDILRDAGLVGAADRITAVGAVSTSSGYKLTLVGVYADSTRTVLLVHADPPLEPEFNSMQLTDQFGRNLDLSAGTSDLRSGDLALQYEALPWPDEITGARITLHLAGIRPADESAPEVPGSWTLQATLTVDQGRPLPLPQAASTGPAHYRFTSVTYTPATVMIDIEVTGVTFSGLDRIIPDGGKGRPALSIDLVDPNGETINGTWAMSPDIAGRVHIHFLGFRLGPGGRHVLRVSYADQGQFERTIMVP